MERISKEQYFFNIAKEVGKRSHDPNTQVGSILVNNDNNSIIATGYNGFVRNAPDDILPTTKPDIKIYMQHSEKNLLLNCARNGISTNNSTLFITLSPCEDCLRMLYQAGIKRIFFINKHRTFNNIINLLDIKVKHEDNWIEFIDN